MATVGEPPNAVAATGSHRYLGEETRSAGRASRDSRDHRIVLAARSRNECANRRRILHERRVGSATS